MITVSLSGVRFKAPIGLYPQEALTHNEIEIDLSVSQDAQIDDLPLIDYTLLHAIAHAAVAEPTSYLETIIKRIADAISKNFPGTKMKIAVRKLHPPMSGSVAFAEVSWES